MMTKVFEQTLSVGYIPSVNHMYKYISSSKRVLAKEVHFFKEEIKYQLSKAGATAERAEGFGYVISTTFMLRTSFGRRDLDNMQKATQDAAFEFFQENDALILQSHSTKLAIVNHPGEREYIKMTLYTTPIQAYKHSI